MTLAENAGDVRTYGDGDLIFAEGSPGDFLYIVAEGTVVIRKHGDIVDTVLAEFTTQDMFGEMALVDTRPHSATAVAVGPTTLRVFDLDSFREALVDDPELALAVIGSLAKRLRDTSDKLQSLATQLILDRAEAALVQKAILESELG